MDPDAALRRLRELVVAAGDDAVDPVETRNALADTFDGLDQWITKGGFLPAEWEPDLEPARVI